MAPKKKCDKRPNKFWEPFNTWWRDHHERAGNRATVVEMREWYWQNAHQVWSAEMVPSLEEMLKLAKGMRTIQQVQDYFRIYRRNLKTRKDDDTRGTKGGGVKKPARHPAVQHPDSPEAPGGFMEAMQKATQPPPPPPPQQQRHCQQQLLAHGASLVAVAAAMAAAAAAAAAATAAASAPQQQQQGHGLGGDEESQLQLDALPLVVEGEEDPEDGQHPGRADEGGSQAASPDDMAADEAPSYGHWESAQQQQQHLESMQQYHQQQQYLPGVSQADFAHRRVMRSVRTSGGGGGSGAVNAVGGSLGGAAVVQTVTRRRTIRTSAGGAWEQEVVEELELDVAQASPLPYGMPMMPYGGVQQQHQSGAGVFATRPYAASAGQAWYHGPGMGAGADNPAAAHTPDGSCIIAAGAPPYKQRRCEDHGVMSAERFSSDGAGVEGADPSCSGQQQAQQEPGMPAAECGSDAQYNPARRTAYSYGGHPSYPAGDLRHKPPHSSDGGVLYGAAPPPHYHPGYHAPPPYHGPAGGSYGGMHATWQQHAQQQQRYPHPAYAHHPAYAAYRHPQVAYPHAPPPYGHPHPHAGYMPPPHGHMPMPYHPAYGHMPMQRNPYGGPYQSYYARPPPEASMMADVGPTVEQEEEASAAHNRAEATATAAAAAEQHDTEAQPQAHVRAVGQATPLQPHAHHRHHYHHAHGPEAAAATPATVRPLRLEDLPPMQTGLPGIGRDPAAGPAVSESFSGLGLSGLTALGQASEGGDEAASHGGGQQPAGEGEGAGAAAAAGADHRPPHHHSQQQQHPRGAGVATGRDAREETLMIVRRPEERGSCGGAAVVSSGHGSGTDGTANLFLTATKAAAASAAAGHSGRRVSSTGAHPGYHSHHHYNHHHHSGLPPRPAVTPLLAPALTPATQPLKLLSGGPTTIRVFQEDMLVLPFGPLGDMAGMGLYSPTASFTLSLGLGEGDGGCGGEVVSWGMGAHGHA